MKKDIRSKLSKYFSSRLKREESVVYILIELGKLLEQDNCQKDYPSIQLFRNWIAHSQLNRANASVLLQSIDSDQEYKYNFLSFEILRLEIKKLSTKYEFNDYLVNEGWFQFRKLLGLVLIDQPILKNNDAKDTEIKELRINKSEDSSKPFIQFSIIKGNGGDVGGGIFYGDGDQHKKLEDELVNIKFDYHYIKKAFLSTSQRFREAKGQEKKQLEAEVDALFKSLKYHEEEISRVSKLVQTNKFEDEYYS